MHNDMSRSNEMVEEEIIRKAYNGDEAALCHIISHYQKYVKKGIKKRSGHYGFHYQEVPADDISQIVWIKFLTGNIHGFKLD